MSDPFAFLNPIASSKTDAEKVLASSTAHPIPPVTIAPLNMGVPAPAGNMGGFVHPPNHGGMGMNMGMGMGMGMMNAPPAANPYGGGMNMNMNMGGMGMGMGMGMGAGMGAPMGAPMGMPNSNAQFPPQQQQQPVMYDNIKNLLQQKPKPPAGAFGDDASMDFLEHLGSGAAPAPAVSAPALVATDPFGSAPAPISVSVAPNTATLDFGLLDSSSSSSNSITHASATSSGAKSSALADRLAHGKRKTQEAARSQLGFNAGAFNNTHAPKISLKDVGGSSGSQRTGSGSMSVDDFAAGVPASTTSSSTNVFDDPFQSDSTPAPRTASGSNSSGNNSRTGSKTAPPIATVDNSFW